MTIYAVITPEAAMMVAAYLDRTKDTACPTQDREAWQEVADALWALSNDTDFIVTDPAVVPEGACAPPLGA